MKLKTSVLLALASSPTLTDAALGPIIVTPSAYKQSKEESNTPITVITQHTIENSGATSVAELLRGQAGLHVRDLFGDGSQATVDLRGFGSTASSNTLILIDGRRLNNSTDGAAPDLSTIDINQIKQIEILQGSAGVLYGNQAIGGVINFIRKDIIDDSTQISSTIGSYNTKSLALSANRLMGQTQLALNLKSQSSDHYRDHNESSKNHLSLRLKRQHQTFSTFIEVETTDDNITTPGALLASEVESNRVQSMPFYDNDYFDTKTNVFRAGLDKYIAQGESISFDFSKRKNDRAFIQSFRPTASSSVTTQDRDSQTLASKYTISFADTKFAPLVLVGFNQEKNDYNLVSSLGPQPITQEITDLYFSTDFTLSSAAQLNLGYRMSDQKSDNDTNNLDDSQNVFSLNYSLKLGDWKTHFRADQNYRYPTVEEHTNTGFGNPVGLKTQTGISYETGIEFSKNLQNYRATVYQINLDNEIAYDEFNSNINLDSTIRKGIIFEANNSWSEQFSSSVSLTYLNAKITDGPFEGNTIPLVPKKTIRLNGSYQLDKATLINVDLIMIGEQNFGGDFSNQIGTLNSYEVVNANVNYHIQHWNFSFRVNNLLNEQYSETGSQYTDYSAWPAVTNQQSFFTAPERNFWFTAKVNF
ncbi:MAG: TonB-dependent receptor [Gammaproteobacteria bacterium]|nr:TonB-dependent receptor [Gammaproteobacteria bacterium]